jgi:hypothetical protein
VLYVAPPGQLTSAHLRADAAARGQGVGDVRQADEAVRLGPQQALQGAVAMETAAGAAGGGAGVLPASAAAGARTCLGASHQSTTPAASRLPPAPACCRHAARRLGEPGVRGAAARPAAPAPGRHQRRASCSRRGVGGGGCWGWGRDALRRLAGEPEGQGRAGRHGLDARFGAGGGWAAGELMPAADWRLDRWLLARPTHRWSSCQHVPCKAVPRHCCPCPAPAAVRGPDAAEGGAGQRAGAQWTRMDAHGGHVVEVHEPSLYSRCASGCLPLQSAFVATCRRLHTRTRGGCGGCRTPSCSSQAPKRRRSAAPCLPPPPQVLGRRPRRCRRAAQRARLLAGRARRVRPSAALAHQDHPQPGGPPARPPACPACLPASMPSAPSVPGSTSAARLPFHPPRSSPRRRARPASSGAASPRRTSGARWRAASQRPSSGARATRRWPPACPPPTCERAAAATPRGCWRCGCLVLCTLPTAPCLAARHYPGQPQPRPSLPAPPPVPAPAAAPAPSTAPRRCPCWSATARATPGPPARWRASCGCWTATAARASRRCSASGPSQAAAPSPRCLVGGLPACCLHQPHSSNSMLPPGCCSGQAACGKAPRRSSWASVPNALLSPGLNARRSLHLPRRGAQQRGPGAAAPAAEGGRSCAAGQPAGRPCGRPALQPPQPRGCCGAHGGGGWSRGAGPSRRSRRRGCRWRGRGGRGAGGRQGAWRAGAGGRGAPQGGQLRLAAVHLWPCLACCLRRRAAQPLLSPCSQTECPPAEMTAAHPPALPPCPPAPPRRWPTACSSPPPT